MTGARRVLAAVLAAALALTLVALGAPARGAGRPGYGDFVRAARALSEWRYAEARSMIAELERRAPDAAETKYLVAEEAFLAGDYAAAKVALDALGPAAPRGLGEDLVSLVDGTLAATRGMTSRPSPKGHFIFFYQPGKDELLVELAGEALDAAWERLGDDLGHKPSQPVRVEFFPRARDLARVSTLPEKAIETTGTIALCKYNKLMVVSPRGTLLGYPWLDTIVHEYAHYVISAATGDRVPVWLQEGLAKFEETRWRAEPAAAGMDDMAQHLLATALKKGRLITFEEMHPSMALLPSQEAAGTAYAQVHAFVGWLHALHGYAGIRAVLQLIGGDRSERRAIAEVTGLRWEAVETAYRKHLRTLPLKLSPQLAARGGGERIKLRKGDADAASDDDAGLERIPEERARRHARLAGMLRTRGHLRAAVVEYERALALVGPGGDPLLAARLGRAYLELGQPDRAVAVLTAVPDLDAHDAGPQTTLGAAYLALGKLPEAETHLTLAVRVQPFDPAVRCGLAEIYGATARQGLAARETRACTLARGGAASPPVR